MSKIFHVLGLMSGTSLDGLDIAYCILNHLPDGMWQYEIPAATTINYSPTEKQIFKNLPHLSAVELTKAHNWFGDFCGNAANDFLLKNKVTVDFIASHGHTVFHQPSEGYTLQIGSGANIHARTALLVVCDFRTVDVALGGQGAPLVPIGDKYLFANYALRLNLGGIANVSFENADNRSVAFDICPVNIVLNALCEKLQPSIPYDAGGAVAKSGKLLAPLFTQLNALSYYQSSYPKSLGKEWVDEYIFPLLAQYSEASAEDLLCTFTHHIAFQIAEVARAYSMLNSSASTKLLATGGGAFNDFLIELLNKYVGGTVEISLPDEQTINFKEALIFAFLGVLRIQSQNNALQSVTGATRDSIGGAIYGHLVFMK